MDRVEGRAAPDFQSAIMATLGKHKVDPNLITAAQGKINQIFSQKIYQTSVETPKEMERKATQTEVISQFLQTISKLSSGHQAGRQDVVTFENELKSQFAHYTGVYSAARDDLDGLKALKSNLVQTRIGIDNLIKTMEAGQKEYSAMLNRKKPEGKTLEEDLAEITKDIDIAFKMDANKQKLAALNNHKKDITALEDEVDESIDALQPKQAKEAKAAAKETSRAAARVMIGDSEVTNPQVRKLLEKVPLVKLLSEKERLMLKRAERLEKKEEYEQLLDKIIDTHAEVTKEDIARFNILHQERSQQKR